MNIMLFGLSNVGKTTAGRILAEKLGYSFYDLDDEIRKKYSMTQQEFIDTFWLRNERDRLRGQLLGEILENDGDKVIAVTPMYYSSYFSKYLKKRDDVIGIEMQDTPENIFNRLVFTDDNDQVYEDSAEYREKHKAYYLKDIKKDNTYYKKAFAKIENKFQINNDPPEMVANRLITEFGLASKAVES